MSDCSGATLQWHTSHEGSQIFVLETAECVRVIEVGVGGEVSPRERDEPCDVAPSRERSRGGLPGGQSPPDERVAKNSLAPRPRRRGRGGGV